VCICYDARFMWLPCHIRCAIIERIWHFTCDCRRCTLERGREAADRAVLHPTDDLFDTDGRIRALPLPEPHPTGVCSVLQLYERLVGDSALAITDWRTHTARETVLLETMASDLDVALLVEHVECAALLAGAMHPHHVKWFVMLERVLAENPHVLAELDPALMRAITSIRRRVHPQVLQWNTLQVDATGPHSSSATERTACQVHAHGC
jgi:hypothetical protein